MAEHSEQQPVDAPMIVVDHTDQDQSVGGSKAEMMDSPHGILKKRGRKVNQEDRLAWMGDWGRHFLLVLC